MNAGNFRRNGILVMIDGVIQYFEYATVCFSFSYVNLINCFKSNLIDHFAKCQVREQ